MRQATRECRTITGGYAAWNPSTNPAPPASTNASTAALQGEALRQRRMAEHARTGAWSLSPEEAAAATARSRATAEALAAGLRKATAE